MSKKRAQAAEPVVQEKKEPEPKHAYNLSIPTDKIGINIANDSYVMAQDAFSLLFERLDDAMMRKRIDREYKTYAIRNTLQMSMNVFSISNIFNDKGDNWKDRDDFEPYDYVAEMTEPAPPIRDNAGRVLHLNKPESLKARVRANIPEEKIPRSA